MEDITDANYLHAEEVCKGFEPKDIGEYHDFHGKIYKFVLADVF